MRGRYAAYSMQSAGQTAWDCQTWNTARACCNSVWCFGWRNQRDSWCRNGRWQEWIVQAECCAYALSGSYRLLNHHIRQLFLQLAGWRDAKLLEDLILCISRYIKCITRIAQIFMILNDISYPPASPTACFCRRHLLAAILQFALQTGHETHLEKIQIASPLIGRDWQ